MSKYDLKQEVTDKYSLRGRVFHKLREDILNGRYKENEELKEVAIGEELGVSRTPVREAFRQLELEGLIQIVPNKGAYVTGITAKDVKDIYMIRSSLEGMCARLATEHITPEQLEELEENVYIASFHGSKGHMEQMTELFVEKVGKQVLQLFRVWECEPFSVSVAAFGVYVQLRWYVVAYKGLVVSDAVVRVYGAVVLACEYKCRGSLWRYLCLVAVFSFHFGRRLFAYKAYACTTVGYCSIHRYYRVH